MPLPIAPPFAPMEARSADAIPEGPEWQYEPKWDGFRCVLFRDDDSVALQAKSGRSLTRYFPELVQSVRDLGPRRFVIDAEIVVPRGTSFSFDDLLQRIHPAASRVQKLAVETPALLIAFDLLVDARGRSLVERPLSERRDALEAFFEALPQPHDRLRLSPVAIAPADAARWLRRTGPMLDGVIAKRRDLPYQSGNRTGMQKIKTYRSADCVVGGFRYNEGKSVVGSLLLGLYGKDDLLHHVGFTSSIKAGDKPALTRKLEGLIAAPGFTGSGPGGPSRWSTGRSAAWQPLRPELVVEVCYDHFTGGRFRHGTSLLRWRPDKSPRQCTLEQVTQKKATLLALLK